MTPRQIITGAALALALAPIAASAQGDLFARLDADGNGTISRDEFIALRVTMFETIDADGSGTITKPEIEAARQALPNQRPGSDDRIWQQDANGDGLLTLAEYTAQTRGFDLADRNDDGVLSTAEFQRVARVLAGKRN